MSIPILSRRYPLFVLFNSPYYDGLNLSPFDILHIAEYTIQYHSSIQTSETVLLLSQLFSNHQYGQSSYGDCAVLV